MLKMRQQPVETGRRIEMAKVLGSEKFFGLADGTRPKKELLEIFPAIAADRLGGPDCFDD